MLSLKSEKSICLHSADSYSLFWCITSQSTIFQSCWEDFLSHWLNQYKAAEYMFCWRTQHSLKLATLGSPVLLSSNWVTVLHSDSYGLMLTAFFFVSYICINITQYWPLVIRIMHWLWQVLNEEVYWDSMRKYWPLAVDTWPQGCVLTSCVKNLDSR